MTWGVVTWGVDLGIHPKAVFLEDSVEGGNQPVGIFPGEHQRGLDFQDIVLRTVDSLLLFAFDDAPVGIVCCELLFVFFR